MATQGFQLVEDDEPAPTAPPSKTDGAGLSLLALGIRTVSQRALAALVSLFTLVTVASAWWLWRSAPDPSIYQIVSLSIYALFVLAVNWIVRRR